MDNLQALLLGLLQGLTEFLPVSSSGHLELGNALLGVHGDDNLLFAIMVHGATVLSTLIVFWKDIVSLFKGLFAFKWNDETRYICMLLLSAIPVGLVGLLLNEQVEALFGGNVFFVGIMLIVTAILLFFADYKKPGDKGIGWLDALIIGLSQAVAVLPGLSRNGTTIATGLLLGKKKDEMARFSFLMVIIPILGANFLELLKYEPQTATGAGIGVMPLLLGFLAAFVSGLFACKLMINVVKKGKLIYFSGYCLIVGIIAIFAGW